MRLTLYSGCRLTKEYNEVIQGSYLEAYLTSLTKVSYENIGEVYLSRSGTFNVSMMTSGTYLYNYFKLEDEVNSITRYFFIDDLEIINGTCVITYTEDIWSSYSSYINIVKGNISNLRYGIGTNPKFLPDNYISNKKLTLRPFGTTDTYFDKFYVVVEFSYYTAVGQGEVVNRHFATGIVTGIATTTYSNMNYDTASGFAEQIYENMSVAKSLKLPNDATWRNYDVTNVYIVPKTYLDNSYYNVNNYVYISNTSEDANGRFATICIMNYGVKTRNYSTDPKFTRYGIGTIDNIIPIEENGKSVEVGLFNILDNIKFTMYLRVGTSITDITNSFNYELPVNIQSADITQQQAIARQVKNLSLDITKDKTAVQGALGVVSGLTQTAIGGVSLASGNISGVSSLVGGLSSTASSVADTIFAMKEINLDRWQNNAKAYSSSTAVKVGKDVQINCYYGICEFSVDPDNSTYIDNLIEVVGYRTNIIVSNNTFLTTAQESKTYNIIKFSNIMLYGNIPHSIQQELSSILTKGIKIYFASTI